MTPPPAHSLQAPKAVAAARLRPLRVALLIGLIATGGFAVSSFAHSVDLPVRVLLPLHWSVLVGGLAFGWRVGLLLGLMLPMVTLLASGLPVPARTLAMALELGTYGAVAGLGAGRAGAGRAGAWRFVLVALIAGRTAWTLATATTMLLLDVAPTLSILASLAPGLPAAALQVAIIPPLATWLRRLGSALADHDD